MSMHLEGPWLSTTGKRKSKQKFASADHARKAREQEESWKALQKKWAVEAEDKKRTRALTAPSLASSGYSLKIPEGRNTTAHIKSVDTGLGNAVLKPTKQYTGTMVKGIAQMAKSNAIPVFNTDHIMEIARMRR